MRNTLATAATVDLAAEARAEIARHKLKAFRVATRIDVHPATLSLALNGHRPITPEFAARIMRAIAEEAAAK